MKLILDVGMPDWNQGQMAALSVMRDEPNQKTGTGNAVKVMIRGKQFSVVRNQDSYTVRYA